MKDKDFKELNNYREVECCGNCIYLKNVNVGEADRCSFNDMEVDAMNMVCDGWEHE